MRRRVLVAILSVTAIAIVLFGIPLAIIVARFVDKEATLNVERQAILAAREVPEDFALSADPVELPANTTPDEVTQWLSASGFTRVQAERVGAVKILDVVADRFRIGSVEKACVLEAIEVALKRGSGRLNVYVLNEVAAQVDTAVAAPD